MIKGDVQDSGQVQALNFRERSSALTDVNTCQCFQLILDVYIKQSHNV